MKPDPKTVAETARRIGIKPEDLDAVVQRGSSVSYQAGDYLFYESSPRQWLGFVLEGEVDLVRGQHGHTTRVSIAQPGAILGDGAMLDDFPHSTSAVTRTGATVW